MQSHTGADHTRQSIGIPGEARVVTRDKSGGAICISPNGLRAVAAAMEAGQVYDAIERMEMSTLPAREVALREQIEILERQVADLERHNWHAARCGRCAVATRAIRTATEEHGARVATAKSVKKALYTSGRWH